MYKYTNAAHPNLRGEKPTDLYHYYESSLQFHAVSLAREVAKLSDPLGLQKPVRSGDTCAIVISGCASDGVNEVVEIVHLSLGKRPAQP